MKRGIFPFIIIALFLCQEANAQVHIFVGPGGGFRPYYGPRYGNRYPRRRQRQPNNEPPFQPTLNFSIGYGFPNLDKDLLADFYRYYQGSYAQTGPVTAAIDYRFSRYMSIGLMASHGTVSAPYYNYNDPSSIAFRGSLNNWAVMLNLVHYIPVNGKILPYIRTAIGVNSWKQDYTDTTGSKIYAGAPPSALAYQVGLGATYNISKSMGVFLEAGYGKYILHGGLSFKLK